MSIFHLMNIRNREGAKSIPKYLKTDEFLNHDYSDCLSPQYTIPGLIISLLTSKDVTINVALYITLTDKGDNTDNQVLGLKRYTLHLVTTQTRCQSLSRSCTRFDRFSKLLP